MKKMNNKVKIAACAIVAGLGLSSCSMDLLPLNEIVLENYWTNEEDVQSVVNSCYNAMQSQSFIQDIMVWGECRSDNTTPNTSADQNLRDLMNGNLRTTNPWCDWGALYTVINRCNTVLHYAPEVAAKDPNFTESEFRITQAEVKFMRAFSYLTLVKTFKDVPFTFEASIDDTQDYRIGQTSMEEILNALIEDIEDCKDFPPIRYSVGIENTARVTRLAMYSLLAELYLWRASNAAADISSQQADYLACVKCCDYIIKVKREQYMEGTYKDKDNRDIRLRSLVDDDVYESYGIPLLKERESGNSTNGPMAFNDIFCDGNSYESIFEITFRKNDDINYAIAMYGGYPDADATSTTQLILADNNLIGTAPTSSSTFNNNTLFSVPTDYRSIESFYYSSSGGIQSIYKYVLSSNYAGSSDYGSVASSGYTEPKSDQTLSGMPSKNSQSPNWILYRLSEIVLFRAEAEIALAGTMAGNSDNSPAKVDTPLTEYRDGASLGTAEELYSDAFNLMCSVYKRSNPQASGSMMPQINNFTMYYDYMTFLMQERRREFLFEGKRYYDMVREARRNGNTSKFQSALSRKYGDASRAILIKMANMDFMYMPILKSQMKLNPNLVQNPMYNDEEESVKN